MSNSAIEKLAINTIRTLSIDAVEKANSGHPGLPMGAAPMAYALWSKIMKHNPSNPEWYNRDRFVLSAGHGSMLLYSLLHLHGYDLPIEELKNFRQWGSKTPGHPESHETPGVEATTGPLGQGISSAVGMAMAERHLAATYNKDGHEIVDHYTYVLCSDGDLMEGISYEATSLAGHLKLGKLICLYDSNDISLDGDLHLSFSENIKGRFEALNWHYVRVDDEHDTEAIANAIKEAQQDERPSLIEVRTTIGYGSPNQGGTNASHGSPLGEDEVKLVKEHYEWPHEPFDVPQEVRDHYELLKQEGEQQEAQWNEQFASYKQAYPELAAQFERVMKGELPEGWDADLPEFEVGSELATRAASGEMINHFAAKVPELWGGSADLAGSNNTLIKSEENYQRDHYSGRNIWFGVREHAMGAALNGIALHGGTRVYGGTFFVFSDYLRPAIRLASLQQLPVTYVFTHDSIGVGEDGPTHEPVEQLAALRAMQGLNVFRPADAHETIAAWKQALEADGPTALVLTRQKLPTLEETKNRYDEMQKGAYIVSDANNGQPELVLLASGSEVSLILEAKHQLEEEGISTRVVSMPSWDLFEKQDAAYKAEVIPADVPKRLAVEMARPLGWERYVGDQGDILGIDTFGASAPGPKVMEEFGFTVENVVQRAKKVLGK